MPSLHSFCIPDCILPQIFVSIPFADLIVVSFCWNISLKRKWAWSRRGISDLHLEQGRVLNEKSKGLWGNRIEKKAGGTILIPSWLDHVTEVSICMSLLCLPSIAVSLAVIAFSSASKIPRQTTLCTISTVEILSNQSIASVIYYIHTLAGVYLSFNH